MGPGVPGDIGRFRDRIAALAPELAASSIVLRGDGWDSLALEVGGEWIFKFPRSPEATERLRREVRLLALLRSRLSITVPDMVLHEADGPVSQHRKIPGEFLLTAGYDVLPAARRTVLADQLALMYAELHAIPRGEAEAAGARRLAPWPDPAALQVRLAPRLPAHLQAFLERTLAGSAAPSMPPADEVFGYFDGHGWNMAFDHATGTLNGVFDFADSGFGTRVRDLSFTSWIHPALTRDIARRYSALTGIPVDPEDAVRHNSLLRLVELADGVPVPEEEILAMLESHIARL